MAGGPVRVTSPAHRIVRLARELGGAHGRAKRGLILLEGLRAVESLVEAASAASPDSALLVTAAACDSPRTRAVVDGCSSAGIPVYELTEALFRAVSRVESPQGIALLVPPPKVRLDEALTADFVLVADRVQDPGNLGALLRAARAFGVGAVVTTAGTAEAANPKAVRAAAGTWPGLPVSEGVEASALAGALSSGGRRVLVAAAKGNRDFREPVWTGRVALIVGNEGRGADPGFASAGAETVRIPIAPGVESLNVGTATAVLLAEAARQRSGGH